MKKRNIFLSIIILILLINILVSPARYISVTLNAITIWATIILPSLLPFIILTGLLSQLGMMDKLCKPLQQPMSILYGTPSISSYVFFMSILSGYPVGSKMIADLYESQSISRQDAYRMTSFCSNSGPMFIIGSVGVGLLFNIVYGYILLFSHILSALINGLIYRKIIVKNNPPQRREITKESSFGDVIYSSTSSLISICAIICLFFIIIETLSPIFSLFSSPVSAFLKGCVEMTCGCIDLAKSTSKFILPLVSFIITFGGLSTIIQSTTILKRTKMPTTLFALQKLTQGLISAIITLTIVLF